jgi:putative MATE family efflux protein
MLSTSLGEKRYDKSDSAANQGILLGFFSFIVFLLIGLFVVEPFFANRSSDAAVIAFGVPYLKIVTMMSFVLFMQMILERLLQSTVLTFYSMITQTTGAVINIILDPIMIFGYFGCPALGTAGAAYATVIGQCIAACLALFFNLSKNKEIHLSIKKILFPEVSTILRIYGVGLPSILMMSIGSIMSDFMNKILDAFSSTAVAVYGVYFRLQSFFFMPVFGMNNGIIPVLAYNYGAKKRERIDEALRFGVVLAVCIMTVGTIIFEAIPGVLLDLFNAKEHVKAIGIPAMRIIALHFPFAAVAISLGTVFQAFSKSIYSLIISVCRQLVVLIPVAWALAYFTNNVGTVWFSFLVAEGVSCTLSIFFFRVVYKQVIEPIPRLGS